MLQVHATQSRDCICLSQFAALHPSCHAQQCNAMQSKRVGVQCHAWECWCWLKAGVHKCRMR